MTKPQFAPETLFSALKNQLTHWLSPTSAQGATQTMAAHLLREGNQSPGIQAQLQATAAALASQIKGEEAQLGEWLTSLYGPPHTHGENRNTPTKQPAQSTDWQLNPAGCLSYHTIKWLHQNNQYLQITDDQAHQLYKHYLGTLENFNRLLTTSPVPPAPPQPVNTQALYQLLQTFTQGLTALLSHPRPQEQPAGQPGKEQKTAGASPGDSRALNTTHRGTRARGETKTEKHRSILTDQEITCAEYTPQLQMELLALDPRLTLQPLLDLGCGENARLVEVLQKEYGLQALGMDRYLSKTAVENKLGLTGDWLTMPLGHNTWGTIISHMGFSNHFIHHHITPGHDGQAARYAARYMEILHALKPGGAFIYAPGLPFMEDLLTPNQYRITKKRVIIPQGNTPTPQPITVDGQSTVYVCKVEKIP